MGSAKSTQVPLELQIQLGSGFRGSQKMLVSYFFLASIGSHCQTPVIYPSPNVMSNLRILANFWALMSNVKFANIGKFSLLNVKFANFCKPRRKLQILANS